MTKFMVMMETIMFLVTLAMTNFVVMMEPIMFVVEKAMTNFVVMMETMLLMVVLAMTDYLVEEAMISLRVVLVQIGLIVVEEQTQSWTSIQLKAILKEAIVKTFNSTPFLQCQFYSFNDRYYILRIWAC